MPKCAFRQQRNDKNLRENGLSSRRRDELTSRVLCKAQGERWSYQRT